MSEVRDRTGWDPRVSDDLRVLPAPPRPNERRCDASSPPCPRARQPRAKEPPDDRRTPRRRDRHRRRTNTAQVRQARGVHPPLDSPEYRSSHLRAPVQPPVPMPQWLTEVTGPLLGPERVTAADADLTTRYGGEPLGEGIIVTGRVLDSDGRAVPTRWSRSGRPTRQDATSTARTTIRRRSISNFDGAGRCVTDSRGGYRFVTIKPGADRGGTTSTPGARLRIHFSLFGRAFTQRLATQMHSLAIPCRAGSDLQLGARPQGQAADDLPVRPGQDGAGLGAVL